jgi:hypothetical protein
MVKGNLTVVFPAEPALPPETSGFAGVQRPFAVRHGWLVAPPFTIVDIALRQQEYDQEERHL